MLSLKVCSAPQGRGRLPRTAKEDAVEYWIENGTGYVLEAWQNATPMHYVQVVLAVVLLGWYLRRFSGD